MGEYWPKIHKEWHLLHTSQYFCHEVSFPAFQESYKHENPQNYLFFKIHLLFLLKVQNQLTLCDLLYLSKYFLVSNHDRLRYYDASILVPKLFHICTSEHYPHQDYYSSTFSRFLKGYRIHNILRLWIIYFHFEKIQSFWL